MEYSQNQHTQHKIKQPRTYFMKSIKNIRPYVLLWRVSYSTSKTRQKTIKVKRRIKYDSFNIYRSSQIYRIAIQVPTMCVMLAYEIVSPLWRDLWLD